MRSFFAAFFGCCAALFLFAIVIAFAFQGLAPHYLVTACAADKILGPGEADRIAMSVATRMGYQWDGKETLDDFCK